MGWASGSVENLKELVYSTVYCSTKCLLLFVFHARRCCPGLIPHPVIKTCRSMTWWIWKIAFHFNIHEFFVIITLLPSLWRGCSFRKNWFFRNLPCVLGGPTFRWWLLPSRFWIFLQKFARGTQIFFSTCPWVRLRRSVLSPWDMRWFATWISLWRRTSRLRWRRCLSRLLWLWRWRWCFVHWRRFPWFLRWLSCSWLAIKARGGWPRTWGRRLLWLAEAPHWEQLDGMEHPFWSCWLSTVCIGPAWSGSAKYPWLRKAFWTLLLWRLSHSLQPYQDGGPLSGVSRLP